MRIGSKLKNYLKNSSLNYSEKIFICVCLIICITINFLKVNSFGKDLDLKSKSAVLIDGNTGRILYGKNENEKMPMASTTKIMTCIVALESGKMNQIIKVSSKAASMPKVKMYAKKGEQYYLKDLLYAMMLESFNDAAMIVAEGIGGSQEEFAKMMNKKAKEIGAKNTNFVTPNGLDADNHYSTAYDMALIGAYATKNKQFNEITNTKSYSFTDVSAKRSITVNNKDMFLAMDNEAIGIKTGFTGKAGYCFVGAVKSNGRHFVSCVLACGWPPNKSYKWKDTTTLMNYGKREYNEKKIIASGTKFQIEIPNGTKKKINVGVSEGYTTLISEDDNVKSETNFNYKLPIKKRDVVGNIIITINGKKTKKIMLYAFENVEKYDYRFVLKKIMKKFFLFYL